MTSAISVSLTQSQVLSVLRSVLISVLPDGIEVVLAEVNRVPEPAGQDFVAMTPNDRTRLATNITAYDDATLDDPSATGSRTDTEKTQLSIQLDVHGPGSADAAQVISTLFRSDYVYDAFAATGRDVAPLYAGEPVQSSFINAEQQIEFRWSIEVVIQANIAVATAQDFAASLHVGLYDYI